MNHSKFNRRATIATTALAMICCLPQQAICDAPIIHIDVSTQQTLESSFKELTDTIRTAEDPLTATRQFFIEFINQINAQNGTSYTMEEVLALLKQNANMISDEYKESLLLGVELLEATQPESFGINDIEARAKWIKKLQEWDFFGLRKVKHHTHGVSSIIAEIPTPVLVLETVVELNF